MLKYYGFGVYLEVHYYNAVLVNVDLLKTYDQLPRLLNFRQMFGLHLLVDIDLPLLVNQNAYVCISYL